MRGCSVDATPAYRLPIWHTEAPVSVTETISTLGAESQIVGTCEKFNRRFWRVVPGSLWLKV